MMQTRKIRAYILSLKKYDKEENTMTNSKSTKRALISSILATLICVAMLIGTTFAWFTDTASTGINKIVSGNLKVGFQYWNGTAYVDASDANLFSENTFWEPGHTEVVYLKVVNKGNLALKYRLSTIDTFEYQYAKNSDGEKILLSEYLKIGIAEGKNAAEGTFASRKAAIDAAAGNLVDYNTYTKENTLLPATDNSESADYLAFVVYMPTTVGNKANAVDSNNLPWIRFALALTATQVEHENDSFDNTYDEGVPYPIVGAGENGTGTVLYNELQKRNPSILLGADAKYYYGWSVGYTATVDLNGHTLTATGSQAVLRVDGDLTITGNGTVNASGGSGSGAAVEVTNGGKVTIESGTFIGKAGNSCIYDGGGTVEIKGGFFKCEGTAADAKYVLNQNNGTHGTITVKGGTFVNYDPSTGDDYLGGNFVADGYKVVSEVHGTDTWYTVVAE